MKILKSFLLAFTISLVFSGIGFADGFNSIYSTDGSSVWAVGNDGLIFYSNTGGATWGMRSQGTEDLNSVFILNQSIWIVGDNGSYFFSLNSGMDWNNANLGSQDLNEIYFIDENNGWIVGESGRILQSTDGGANWVPYNSNLNNDLNSIKMTSTTSGVICGSDGKVLIYNGTDWNEITTPTTVDLLSVDKKSNTIICTAEDGFIIKSTDNGASWTTIDYRSLSKSEVYSVQMFDENTFYSCGGGGFIRKSDDGGASFTFQANPMMANLVDIHFSDANNGWAVSSLNNAILRTTDGGVNWKFPTGTTISYTWSQKQSASGNIGNGFCYHPFNKNGLFIAMGKKVFRSFDKGNTWQQVSTISYGSRAHTFFVSPADSNYWIASMDESSGRVVRSTNYGQTWTVTWGPGALTNYGMPMMLDWNDPDRVYLNPDNSKLLKSTDFGLTWESIGTKVFRSPDNITIPYNNPDIIFSGDGVTGNPPGELFKTTNGGLNWTLENSVSGSEIPFTVVSNIDTTLSFHTCWSSGGIWRTNDLWENKTQVATTTGAWAADIAKDDPTAFAYGVYGSSVYISTDRGETFKQTSVGSSPEAGMYFFDKANLLSQKGGGVYKLNITYSVITNSSVISTSVPEDFSVSQNYPNPFNPVTKFKVSIPANSNLKVIVFDVLGRQLEVLVDKLMPAGTHEITFDGGSYQSGVYFCKFITDGFSETRKMMLLK